MNTHNQNFLQFIFGDYYHLMNCNYCTYDLFYRKRGLIFYRMFLWVSCSWFMWFFFSCCFPLVRKSCPVFFVFFLYLINSFCFQIKKWNHILCFFLGWIRGLIIVIYKKYNFFGKSIWRWKFKKLIEVIYFLLKRKRFYCSKDWYNKRKLTRGPL